MENKTLNIDMMKLILAPCFCVKNGIIIARNKAAQDLLIPQDTAVESLLDTGKEEYACFTGGSLYLTINHGGVLFGAAVERMDGIDYFLLESPGDEDVLCALALAARELRAPLCAIMASMELMDQEMFQSSKGKLLAGRMSHSLFQMQRIVSNMSTSSSVSHPEMVDIDAALREIMESAAYRLEATGVQLRYQGLDEPLYTLADSQELERAILNLLANAVKFSPQGSPISASLTRQGKMLRLCIQDGGSGIPDGIRGSVFRRYLRQPTIEDSRHGIGLGLVIVRSAACNHGGTVLIDHPAQGGTRVSMTLDIRQDDTGMLQSPRLRIDYAGEQDHTLIELAEVLGPEAYTKE